MPKGRVHCLGVFGFWFKVYMFNVDCQDLGFEFLNVWGILNRTPQIAKTIWFGNTFHVLKTHWPCEWPTCTPDGLL